MTSPLGRLVVQLRRRDVFEADRWSHRERIAREARSPAVRFSRWWRAQTAVDRVWALFGWSIGGLLSIAAGAIVGVLLGPPG